MSLEPAGNKSFAQNQDGAVAVIFGLVAVVLVMVVGLAVDVGRAIHADSTITGALDAAALATAKSLRDRGVSDAEATAIATRFFNNNINSSGGHYATINTFTVQVDRDRHAVTIDVGADVPMVIGPLAGVRKVSLPKSSVALFDTKDIELSLQLDVTGSMCSPCRKLDDLKDAVAGSNGLLDIMLPDDGTTNKVRIGLAPFASGVNAGAYAATVSENRSADGCVYERRNLADQASEAPALGALSLKVRADLGSPGACPTDAKVMAMSDSKDVLRTTVNGWRTSTATAGHLGASWAWYLLSPEWSGIWPADSRPAAYGDGKTMKVVILMTDGIYNTVGGTSNGDHGSTATQSTQLAQDTCLAMRNKGITVYTIGFEAPNGAKTALRACASDPSKFYDAADGDQLRLAFRAIASEINNLRLSR